jgi:hypothetical protein
MKNLAAFELVQRAMGVAQVGIAMMGCAAGIGEVRVSGRFPSQGQGWQDRDFLQRGGLSDQHLVELFLEVAGTLAMVAGVVPLDAELLGDVGPIGRKPPMEEETAASMQQDRQRGRYEQELPQEIQICG